MSGGRPHRAAPLLQLKLRIGSAGDALEREADRVATQLTQGSSAHGDTATAPQWRPQLRVPDVQRTCTECEEEQRVVQRSAEHRAASPPQRDGSGAASAGGGTDAVVHSALAESSIPLPSSLRRGFSDRLGADLSAVRLHTGPAAARSAAALAARAYTTGAHIVFGQGEYAPQSPRGRFLLAHELVHTLQQGATPKRIQRWSVGTALPAAAPANWQLVPPDHLARLALAEADIRRVLASRTCQRYFRDNCTGGTADSLQSAFDNAVVFHRNTNDDTFGGQLGTSPNIAYNSTAFRIGHWFMASTLLHEAFHTCDSVFDAGDERTAENAAEACHLHTPFIVQAFPRVGPAGTRVTLLGFSFGGNQSAFDRVELNGVPVPVISWGFRGGAGSSEQRIVIEIPADATSGDLVVINNNVRSNARGFAVG